MFDSPCETFPSFVATRESTRETSSFIAEENSRKFATVASTPTRFDSTIARTCSLITRMFSTMSDSRSSPWGPPIDALRLLVIALMSTAMSRASFVISSKDTGTPPTITELSGSGGAPKGPGTSSTYFSPRSPRLSIEAEAPWRSETLGSSSTSTNAFPSTRRIFPTLPTLTPATLTAVFSSSPPTSLNWTVTFFGRP